MPTTPKTAITDIPDNVASVFSSCEEPVQTELLALRELILATAAETECVGSITETLKWGQPAYLTEQTGSGSTIRIAPSRPGSDHDYAMFFICHTNLIERVKRLFDDAFTYDGERALLFRVGEPRPENELRECVVMALTYHVTD